jgi:hypothetical protein
LASNAFRYRNTSPVDCPGPTKARITPSQTVVWRMGPVLEVNAGTYPDMPFAIRAHNRWVTCI